MRVLLGLSCSHHLLRPISIMRRALRMATQCYRALRLPMAVRSISIWISLSAVRFRPIQSRLEQTSQSGCSLYSTTGRLTTRLEAFRQHQRISRHRMHHQRFSRCVQPLRKQICRVCRLESSYLPVRSRQLSRTILVGRSILQATFVSIARTTLR